MITSSSPSPAFLPTIRSRSTGSLVKKFLRSGPRIFAFCRNASRTRETVCQLSLVLERPETTRRVQTIREKVPHNHDFHDGGACAAVVGLYPRVLGQGTCGTALVTCVTSALAVTHRRLVAARPEEAGMKAFASPWLPRRFAKTRTSWTGRCLLIALALGLARTADATITAVPMKRMGEAWDVAWAAAFLASDEARYITGVVLPVDGGLSCKGQGTHRSSGCAGRGAEQPCARVRRQPAAGRHEGRSDRAPATRLLPPRRAERPKRRAARSEIAT
jgi:hypothetical protein